jgi:ribosomal protein S18 acetylase RimI-like enzyme
MAFGRLKSRMGKKHVTQQKIEQVVSKAPSLIAPKLEEVAAREAAVEWDIFFENLGFRGVDEPGPLQLRITGRPLKVGQYIRLPSLASYKGEQLTFSVADFNPVNVPRNMQHQLPYDERRGRRILPYDVLINVRKDKELVAVFHVQTLRRADKKVEQQMTHQVFSAAENKPSRSEVRKAPAAVTVGKLDLSQLQLNSREERQVLRDILSVNRESRWLHAVSRDIRSDAERIGLHGQLFQALDAEGKMAGYAWIRINEDVADWYLIAVREKWQGRGVARKLADAVLDYLHENRIRKVDAVIHLQNRKSQQFFDRLIARRKLSLDGVLVSSDHADQDFEAAGRTLKTVLQKIQADYKGRKAFERVDGSLFIDFTVRSAMQKKGKVRSELRAVSSGRIFESKRIFVDFNDLAANFSDEQITEVLYTAERPHRNTKVIIYNLDITHPVGRFLRGLKLENLETSDKTLPEASAMYVQNFQGDIVHLSSESALLGAAKLKRDLAKNGILSDAVYSLSYKAAASGTLGVGLKDLQDGRLKKQLPDYMAYDAQGRIYLSDPSVAGIWQGIYESALAFSRAA